MTLYVPYSEPIFVEIAKRLALVEIASGYHNTLKTIERARIAPFIGTDLPAANFWASGVKNKALAFDQDERTISLTIEAHSKHRDEPFVNTCDRLASDVLAGLNRKTTAPLYSDPINSDLGGIVDSFEFLGYGYQIGDGDQPICGVLMNFTIKFMAVSNSVSA